MVITPLMAGPVMLKDYTSQFDHNACTIYGVDKPKLVYDSETGKFNSFFHDMSTMFGHWNQRGNRMMFPKTEYFYNTPDMPELTIKQTHVLKKSVEHMFRNKSELVLSKMFKKVGSSKYMVEPTEDFIKVNLYPGWNINTFQTGKLASHFFTDYLKFLWDDPKIADYWNGHIKEFVHKVDNALMDIGPDGRAHKFNGYSTVPHYL
jgi:hypothetical protein